MRCSSAVLLSLAALVLAASQQPTQPTFCSPVVVVPMDAGYVIIGGRYKRQVAHRECDDQTVELARRLNIPCDARLHVPPDTRFVRVIVYDAAADPIGSVLKRVQ
jgi:hypothetical protein